MAKRSLRPGWWEDGCAALAARDAVMAELIARFPEGFMQTRGDALVTLLRSIVGQQISVKAAASIWARFEEAVGKSYFEGERDNVAREMKLAKRVLAVDEVALRGCGFSGQKVKYVRGVCEGFVDGTVHPGLWNDMGDEAVIAELVRLPGIGRWTAEMFLMFHLLRPDVLPVGDLGVVNGFKRNYGANWKTDTDMKGWQKRLTKAAEQWRPQRSIAVWYLWRSLDPGEIAY